MSIKRETVKAVKIVLKVAVQSEEGITTVWVSSSSGVAPHNWPLLAHSQARLSLPRCSSQIIKIARTRVMIRMKGQTALHALIQRYERFDMASMLAAAAAATTMPIPPYMNHSGETKKRN